MGNSACTEKHKRYRSAEPSSFAAGKITGQSTFTVKLADYQIEVPRLVKNNISETIEIRVNCLYDHSL